MRNPMDLCPELLQHHQLRFPPRILRTQDQSPIASNPPRLMEGRVILGAPEFLDDVDGLLLAPPREFDLEGGLLVGGVGGFGVRGVAETVGGEVLSEEALILLVHDR